MSTAGSRWVENAQEVALAEIEDLLRAHPSIADATVVGVSDEEKGCTAKAFVVHCDNTLSAEDVQRFIEGERMVEHPSCPNSLSSTFNTNGRNPSEWRRRVRREHSESS
ncbi:unnamed protein product [Heligmosomoides polygyrus]|uniref:AMP-binding_C domain-containing protein n=1 Tax=Heligmosomoides polygyrus TaxID=6339 RepID=A0A183GV87_HELPZ|nr:unnamed protein product [Heligmosomoides polygyrus]